MTILYNTVNVYSSFDKQFFYLYSISVEYGEGDDKERLLLQEGHGTFSMLPLMVSEICSGGTCSANFESEVGNAPEKRKYM